MSQRPRAKRPPRLRPDPSAATGRQGTYTRGIERREVLLRTVLRLIARGGVGEVTHRAVAREAGVSLRATTYYFDSKEAMIQDALRFFAAQNVSRADAIAQRFPSARFKLDAAVDAVVGVMAEEMADPCNHLAAEYELILAISREPAYAPEYLELQRKLERRLEGLMRTIGSNASREHARIVLAASRGLQIEHLARPSRPLSMRMVRTLMRSLIRALVPGSETDPIGPHAGSMERAGD